MNPNDIPTPTLLQRKCLTVLAEDRLRNAGDKTVHDAIVHAVKTIRTLERENVKLSSRLTETEKMVVGLKEVLVYIHGSIGTRKHEQDIVAQALSQVPQSIAQKFVKREVLEKLLQAIESHNQLTGENWACKHEARTELSSTEPKGMKITKELECPECGYEIVDHNFGYSKQLKCFHCHKTFSVEHDAEFVDGSWRDLTTLHPTPQNDGLTAK